MSLSSEADIGDRRADAVIVLGEPDGGQVDLVLEVRPRLEVRDVPAMREQLSALAPQGAVGVVLTRYLSASVRERLAESGLSYIDATGNMLVRADSPALYLADRGADRDPWRGPGRPRGSLKGEPAARVVRALVDFPGPWKIRDLVAKSGTSTGSVYRVIEFLDREALIVRDESGPINVPDWTAVLRRWSQDYQFLSANRITRWIAPRGLPAFLDRVRSSGVNGYAMTGSIATAAWESYAPARSGMIYATDPDHVADAWGLRATETGVNVLIAEPAYSVVMERSSEALDGIQVAAPAQVAVDLLTGPGRAPSEGEQLLDWMGRNEQSWR